MIIEEAEDLRDEDDFSVVDLSIRGSATQKRLRTIFLLNPTDTEHFIYKRWFDSEWYGNPSDDYSGVIKDTLYILSHWKDVQAHLPKPSINELMRLKKERPNYYKYAIDGAWMHSREGVIYDANNWSVADYVQKEKTIIGLDFGFTHPTAMIQVSVDHETRCLWMRELLYKPGMTPDDMLKFIVKHRLMDHQFVADSARPEIIEQLKRKHVRIKPSKKGAGSVLDGINLMQDYQMFIDPTSHNLQKELKMYIWADGLMEKPVKEWDDALDAARYAVMALRKRKEIKVY